MPEYFYGVATKIKENKKTAFELLTYSEDAEEYKELFNSELHKIKFFPKSVNFMSDTIIIKNKVFFISYDLILKNISATEISNSEIYKTQKVLFDEMWGRY
jgi:hypothetical protein